MVAQIVRIWHGRVPTTKADEYMRLMEEVGLSDYAATPGNQGAWALRRAEGDVTHVMMLTVWESLDAVRGFAGEPVEAARYYDFDADYLLELEPTATHYQVTASRA